jgi:hypothetical protein
VAGTLGLGRCKTGEEASEAMNGQPTAGRHADAATRPGDELVRQWVRQGKVWLWPVLLSDYGHDLIYRKYDAIATDRAYENKPSGRWGPVGKAVDWIVLQQDIHVGLRQRLAILTDAIAGSVRDAWARGRTPVRLASGPCGLARDLRQTWVSLGAPAGRLELLGLDLDSAREVLPLASRLAQEAGVPLRTARCDLLDHQQLERCLDGRPVDVFVSIGLTVWLDPPDLARLLDGLRHSVAPGGSLIVDNFRSHGASRFAADLEMRTRYHPRATFEQALRAAGFQIEWQAETRNHVNVVSRCRRPAGPGA